MNQPTPEPPAYPSQAVFLLIFSDWQLKASGIVFWKYCVYIQLFSCFIFNYVEEENTMSGGDGKGHNSGAHSTGGVNGGPTGLGGGGSHGGGVGSGEGAFKVASQRSEGGWLNSYNAAGQLIGSTRQSGNGSGNSGNGGGSANNDAEKARLAAEEAKRQAEEAKRQAEEAEIKRKAAEEAAKWDAAHPVEVAERQVNEAQQRMDQALQDKSSAEQRAANHDAVANGLQNEVSPLLKEAQEFRDKFANLAKGGIRPFNPRALSYGADYECGSIA